MTAILTLTAGNVGSLDARFGTGSSDAGRAAMAAAEARYRDRGGSWVTLALLGGLSDFGGRGVLVGSLLTGAAGEFVAHANRRISILTPGDAFVHGFMVSGASAIEAFHVLMDRIARADARTPCVHSPTL